MSVFRSPRYLCLKQSTLDVGRFTHMTRINCSSDSMKDSKLALNEIVIVSGLPERTSDDTVIFTMLIITDTIQVCTITVYIIHNMEFVSCDQYSKSCTKKIIKDCELCCK